MSTWTAKKFWSDVTVMPAHDGFSVELDGRSVKTPAKAALIVPTEEMGQAIAQEWRDVEEVVDPNVMPFTRSANAAIDKVTPQFNDVVEMLAAYGGSDLLCYRATHPDALIARQAATWDPILDWADDFFGARLIPTAGLMPVDQNPTALSALKKPLVDATSFELTALHDLIALSGSLVLGLAVAKGHLSAAEAWPISRLDELWQAEQWGEDEDAVATAEIKEKAFEHAAIFHEMSKVASNS